MITRRFYWGWIFLSALFIISISGCYAEKPPQEVTQKFWRAIVVQDIENARKYTTKATRGLVDVPSTAQFRSATITFDKITIYNNTTAIETNLQVYKNDTETTVIPLQTILKQEDGEWKVDYQETRESIVHPDTVSDIAKDLQKLGKKLSDHMDEALEEVRQKIPEYEEKLRKLGVAASRKMEEAVQRQLSEIKKGIEELGNILDEVLKKEENSSDEQESQ